MGQVLTGDLCCHGETEDRHPSGLSNSAALGEASGDSRQVEDTEAFMRIMLHRVLLPRGVACYCRKIAPQCSLPLLQGLWLLLHCGKETLAASGHAAPREQERGTL